MQLNHANDIQNSGDPAHVMPRESDIHKNTSNKQGQARTLGEKLKRVRESTSNGATAKHKPPWEEGRWTSSDRPRMEQRGETTVHKNRRHKASKGRSKERTTPEKY